jgi:hypothetical protein
MPPALAVASEMCAMPLLLQAAAALELPAAANPCARVLRVSTAGGPLATAAAAAAALLRPLLPGAFSTPP